MASREVLIFEMFIRVDRVSTCTIMLSNVSSLDYEAINDAVYFTTQVVQLASLWRHRALRILPSSVVCAILSSAKTTEILRCQWCNIVV